MFIRFNSTKQHAYKVAVNKSPGKEREIATRHAGERGQDTLSPRKALSAQQEHHGSQSPRLPGSRHGHTLRTQSQRTCTRRGLVRIPLYSRRRTAWGSRGPFHKEERPWCLPAAQAYSQISSQLHTNWLIDPIVLLALLKVNIPT